MANPPAIGSVTYTKSDGAHFTYDGYWNVNTTYNGAYTDAQQTVKRTSGGDEVLYAGAYWLSNYVNSGADPLEANTTNAPGSQWILAPSKPGGGANTPNYAQVVPNAPTNLTAGYVSSSTVALFWSAAYVPGLGTVSSYDVYDNGTEIGTTTSTSFTATGLSPSSANSFSVYATDGTGVSGAAANHQVVTSANANGAKYFSPYVDMTLPSTDILSMSQASGLRDFTLAFMQSVGLNSNGVPTISWGGLDSTKLPLPIGSMIQEVKAVEAEGGNVTISFGGYTGLDAAVEAATYASTVGTTAAANNLQAEFQSVISTYGVNSLDFDLEPDSSGDILANTAANTLRDTALAGLEAVNPNLKVSFTLAVNPAGLSTPAGLSQEDFTVIAAAMAAGVNINTINIMAMDYNVAVPDMALAAISAAQATEAQLTALGSTAKVGITPMIGQNDTESEVMTLLDVQTLEAFAASTPWVAGMGDWELPRDTQGSGTAVNGGGDSTNTHPATSTSSDVVQTAYEFAHIMDQIESATLAGATTSSDVYVPAGDSVTSVAHGAAPHAITTGGSATLAGTYGTLTLASTGSYTYAATNGLAIVTAADGTAITDAFTDTVTNPSTTPPSSTPSLLALTVSLAAGGSELLTNMSGSAMYTIGATTLTVDETAATSYSGVIQDGSSGNVGGNLAVEGSSALTLTGTSTYTGKTSVSGTLDIAGLGSIQSSTKVSLTQASARFDISGASARVVVYKLGGVAGSTVDLGGEALKIKAKGGTVDTFSGSIHDGGVAGGSGGSVTLGGLGELVLAAANTYTGGTVLNAGTLDLQALGAAGTGTITFANPAYNATLQIDAGALTGSGGHYNFANLIAGATSKSQIIDLTSLAYVAGSTATMSGTTISVINGSTSVNLHLASPQPNSSWFTASDGRGGTIVYDPPKAVATSPALTASVDSSWIEMAMSNVGGVSNDLHVGSVGQDPYSTKVLASTAPSHAASSFLHGTHTA